MADHPKHFLEIRNRLFELGNDIEIEEDLDVIYKTLTFSFPELVTPQFNTFALKKFDAVTLYFNTFPTKALKEAATKENCKVIFTGYIDTIEASESKVEGVSFTISCKSSLGLTYERTTITKAFNDTMAGIFQKGLQETALWGLIPYIYISSDLVNVYVQVTSEYNFGSVLEQIKKDYPIKIIQTGDGGVWVTTPSFFNTGNLTATNIQIIKAPETLQKPKAILSTWAYDLETNVTNIDYGNTTNNINCIVCYGLNVIGAAYDPIAYEAQFDTSVIVPQNLSVEVFYKRDIISIVECRKFAYEKLLERNKNYVITFDSYYRVSEQIGDLLTIQNSKLISEKQKWTIKRRLITISKNNINSNITAYRTGLADIPLENSTNSTLLELLYIDILNIQDKLEGATIANQLGD